MKKRNNIIKIILTTITIFWMSIIFIFSNQGSVKSNDYSDSFIKRTIVNVYRIFDNNPTEEKIQEIINTWDFPVRKLAHFTEYFILGVLIFLTLNCYNVNNIYIMILICFLYASSDEIHQLFVVGRDGNVMDILLDSFASTVGILSMNLFNRKNKEVL